MNGKGYKILIWTVVLLVLCNIGLVATIWLKPGAKQGHRGPRDFVISSLKFSDDQVKQYDALIEEHQRSMRRLRREAMEYRQQLFNNIKNEGHGGVNADSLAGLIADHQRQIENVTYGHFVQVRALCTDAQKEEFDKIIGDVIRKMNGGGHGGPPPPGEDGNRPHRGEPGAGPGDDRPREGPRQGPPPPPPEERQNP
jgi:periplasmic protein CpxP/Spy